MDNNVKIIISDESGTTTEEMNFYGIPNLLIDAGLKWLMGFFLKHRKKITRL